MKDKIIKSLNGMAYGLFASLVVGTILVQIGDLLHIPEITHFGMIARLLMGAAIGAGVTYQLEKPALVIFSAVVTGMIGASALTIVNAAPVLKIGDPLGAYIAAVCTAVVGGWIHGKTKLDLLLVPMSCILVGGYVGITVSPYIAEFTYKIGALINQATEMEPLFMGAIVAVILGLVLVSPISSAALATSLGLSGLAAGAAVVGCASQMVGFAIISYRDNGVQGLIAQGIGTAKIQFPNVVKNPLILIPTTVTSVVLGALSTTVFKMKCNSIGAGMGTSGLVGPIQTLAVMGTGSILFIGLLHFLLPGLLSELIARPLRRLNWIKKNDMKLTEF